MKCVFKCNYLSIVSGEVLTKGVITSRTTNWGSNYCPWILQWASVNQRRGCSSSFAVIGRTGQINTERDWKKSKLGPTNVAFISTTRVTEVSYVNPFTPFLAYLVGPKGRVRVGELTQSGVVWRGKRLRRRRVNCYIHGCKYIQFSVCPRLPVTFFSRQCVYQQLLR